MPPILPDLHGRLSQLSRAAARVAQFIIAQPADASRMAISELAEVAQVSEPTVIRLCRTLGYGGWPDFKVQLAASLISGVPYVHSALNPHDDIPTLSNKIFDNAVSALLRVRDTLAPDQVARAIDRLSQARRIEFHGLGNSGIVANDAQLKFFRFDLAVVAYTDSHTQSMAAALLGPQDVLIAISHSGRSRELLDATALAQSNGCPIIAITASGSPLAGLADILLQSDIQEDTDLYSPMISRLAHLAIIDVLALGLALRCGAQASHALGRTKQGLKGKR
ncbi:SIS domain-containing protein [Castellaniella sp.]|uniref:SIS domain-containing protein n=1 Tax=Castellaniella sp. TaxID=1955812 RepID=UPI002B002313|nr:SIS domain-containing protein [Castellaniella sp.]